MSVKTLPLYTAEILFVVPNAFGELVDDSGIYTGTMPAITKIVKALGDNYRGIVFQD